MRHIYVVVIMQRQFFYLLIAALAIVEGCAPKANMAGYNMSHAYEQEAAIAVQTKFLDQGDYLRVYHNFTFNRIAPGSTPADVYRRYSASYKMTLGYQSQALIIEDTLNLARMSQTGPQTYSLAYNLKKPATPSAVLVLYMQDRAGGEPLLFDVSVQLADAGQAYKYSLFNKVGNKPLYCNYVTAGDTASLRTLSPDNQPVYMRFYPAQAPAALPPMAVPGLLTLSQPQKAAALYTLNVNNLIVFAEPGLYHLSIDTLKDPGLVVLVEPAKYPRVTQPLELVPPLIYMTTRAERAKLQAAKLPKRALDAFWLDIASNYDYARRLIKAWYENVEYANTWFTDYREGWKTDRGMIFIVFGKPGQVLRQEHIEEWIYEERGATPQLRFVFDQRIAPVGPQIWELRRSPDYDRYWYATVDQWRKGIIRR